MSATTVAVVVPVRGGEPALGAPEAVAEGLDAAGPAARCRLVLVGDGVEAAHDALARAGFADVPTLRCEAPRFMPGRFAQALVDLLDGEDLVLLPASNDGRDLAPRLAALLERPLVAGAVSVDGRRAEVARAGGAALAEVMIDGPVVATLQPGARGVPVRTAPSSTAAVDVPAFAAFAGAADVEVVEVLPPEAATMDLAEASFIVGAGAGLGAPEAFARLEQVAAGLGASVGATRVVTDAGWTGHDRQIGTTGVVVDPEVYVAFGISGAVQHTSGLGDPAHVVSVNLDPHCPMASLAELAVVADAPAVVDALARRLGLAGGDAGRDGGARSTEPDRPAPDDAAAGPSDGGAR